MRTLFMAVYFEGVTDERFIPEIARRTAAELVAKGGGRDQVEVAAPDVVGERIDRDFGTQEDRVAQAASEARNADVLVVHADADSRDATRALTERYAPGRDLAERHRADGRPICRSLLPVVPIRMTEAWMLADHDALRAVVPGPLDIAALPAPPKAVEGILDPKAELERLLRAVSPRRRRRVQVGELYRPLAQTASLACLRRVPAYKQFEDDLAAALADQRFLET